MSGPASAFLVTAGAAGAKEITVGYVAAGLQYPFNVAVAKGFQDADKAANAKAIILDSNTSVEKQGNAIDYLISESSSKSPLRA